MIPDIIKFFNGEEIPMFQNSGKMIGPNIHKDMRFTGIGEDSRGNKFGYTGEMDNNHNRIKEIISTGDSLKFVNGSEGSEIFTSPYKHRSLKMNQMSPDMWKRFPDHFDELIRQWIENPTMR